MAKHPAARRTSERVEEAARKAGINQTELSRLTDIPYTSLGRKINPDSKYEFNISELVTIAEALNMHPSELIADELTAKTKAA